MLEDKAVLIIDDDSTLLSMYGEQLKFNGMIVEYAHDGEEALVMANQNTPNVIVLDIMMPKMNGFDVLAFLKSDDVTKDIPVIVLSALSDSEKMKTALDLGAAKYLVKADILPIDLINTISELLA